MRKVASWIAVAVLAAAVIGLGALIVRRLPAAGQASGAGAGGAPGGSAAAPVEVAPITRGPIESRRTFSGTLEATSRVTIAPKVAGRLLGVPLDVADTVERGQVVAVLDSAEYEQAVMQADAELAVARATVTQAESAAEIAARELDRVRTLQERGVASESQLDTVVADNLAKKAAVEVARSQVTRAEAALETARIRLGYTTIHAEWAEGDDTRLVAERFVEEGDTVAANTALLSIIELHPIEAVVYVAERDYGQLSRGQAATITTDAYEGRRWTGEVARIAPVFREGSRQARVEIRVPNEDGALKPGMFVRAEIVFGRVEDATLVPVEAMALREGRTVVFVVGEGGTSVRMVPVTVGYQDAGLAQVSGEGLEGRVVTLGQQLLDDGSAISIPGAVGPASGAGGG